MGPQLSWNIEANFEKKPKNILYSDSENFRCYMSSSPVSQCCCRQYKLNAARLLSRFISSKSLITSHLDYATLFDYVKGPSRNHNSTFNTEKHLLILKHPCLACFQSFGKESHFCIFWHVCTAQKHAAPAGTTVWVCNYVQQPSLEVATVLCWHQLCNQPT